MNWSFLRWVNRQEPSPATAQDRWPSPPMPAECPPAIPKVISKDSHSFIRTSRNRFMHGWKIDPQIRPRCLYRESQTALRKEYDLSLRSLESSRKNSDLTSLASAE